MSIELYEYLSLKLVERCLTQKIQEFLNCQIQIDFEELLLLLSRQGEGRSRTFNYTINELITMYFNENLTDIQGRELRLRIAASPIYKVAIERFVANSLTHYLTRNNFDYLCYFSPNSADFAILLNNDILENLSIGIEVDFTPLADYRGILLSVDSKSIMGLSNLGDALTRNNELGKFEAHWNQISYEPPRLRNAILSGNQALNQKYQVIRNVLNIDNNNYLFVSIFVCDLVFLPYRTNYFEENLINLSANYFNHSFYTVSIPNGSIRSSYYDSFFSAGKGGNEMYSRDGVEYSYPKDCRFQIKNDKNQYLKFKNLLDHPNRFVYIPNNPNRYSATTLNNMGELKRKDFRYYR